MKKSAWVVLTLMIALGGAGAVFLWRQPAEIQPVKLQAPSQQDTEIDESSGRDLLEYALSGLGETDLNHLQNEIGTYANENDQLRVDDTLFAQYVRYKKALAQLTLPDTSQNIRERLMALNDALLALQSEYFTPEQQAQLFGDENRWRQLAIDKLDIQEHALDEAEQRSQMVQINAELPDYLQKSERNATMVTALIAADSQSEQNRYLRRAELVGESGAQRLAELDSQRASFKAQLDDYLQQRSEILADEQLGEQEKEQQITALREQYFDPVQWRRVEALERIYGQSE
ncbi:lipase secretion chaperone [Vibrio mangrovi]|uniref:Lipase chaperone n=1 Tax=Vibrio mangrovi TaxID=474394 RepID=A0A1Y6ISG9_9VIBR|nr:lipase secretion chaperone [Vibrio mangrovi]MDW6001402.1 lipase secretion chaperone [Vibrio mangrovi]SMS00576.1 lipase chaperone [Vibrio mangrovi]